MIRYAHRHIMHWKDGAFFDYGDATHIVSYDQKNDAYQIASGDEESFEEFVAINWPCGADIRKV